MKAPTQQQNVTYAIHSNILQKNVNPPVTVAANLDTAIETAPTQKKMKGAGLKTETTKAEKATVQSQKEDPKQGRDLLFPRTKRRKPKSLKTIKQQQ